MECDSMRLTAIIHKENNIYVAECNEVGTVSQGYTIEDALASLKEATELYLEETTFDESFVNHIIATFNADVKPVTR